MAQTGSLDDLRSAIDTLRSPGGCPWSAEQTHRTLLPYLIEECYEYVDAVETGTADDMVEELGDVLWQVVFHSRLGEEDSSAFTLDDVAAALLRKVVRRHPHVFDTGSDAFPGGAVDIEWVEGAWETIKAAEKSDRESMFDGIPTALPALTRAHKVLRRIGRARLDVPDPESATPGDADPEAGRIGAELLTLVREAEEKGVDAEAALRHAVRDLERAARRQESS
ncbi:nucleoside triphosphate pyrophosphohydrolase [Spelaeicoccus albus]|uniref:XTP/dITP diphosphohydrolase n=1 Tax=Spelaeicoccus albus TaxID=1280376 RepID=A0A7Z0IHQ1_9MICO|nr:MazG family protein [Spelaeicoccus albus]NYI67865.1 XTP/dITP diphosphohydrolase [Spelaeicoccus albus]